MSKLQTYISERRKLFRERFRFTTSFSLDGSQAFTATFHSMVQIESFNTETERGIIEKIIEFIDSRYPMPSTDTGWSIDLSDVKEFLTP